MKINKTMIVRKVAGETVLVPLGDALKDSTGLFMLTESGSFIWDILPECDTADDIVDRLLEEYDVQREQAAKDVEAFLENLRSYEIID